MNARWDRAVRPAFVAGPTTGGLLVSYEVERHLGVRSIFAEKEETGGRSFQRGFTIAPGERVLVVDDVLTTGGSIHDVLDAVRRLRGEPAGVAAIIDRSGGKTRFRVAFFARLPLGFPPSTPPPPPPCVDGPAASLPTRCLPPFSPPPSALP